MLQVRTLYQTSGVTAVELATTYSEAYTQKDYNQWPCISFPTFSCFEYAAANDRYLLTSNQVLFEQGSLEYEVKKLPHFNSDTTVSFQFQNSESETVQAFLRSGKATALGKRSPRTDYLLTGLAAGSAPTLFKEYCFLELLNEVKFNAGQDNSLCINRYSLRPVEQAKQFVFENFQNKIGIADMAAAVYLSPFHFCRLFKKIAGVSPYHYLLAIRLEEACKLLRSGETVTQTAFKAGFQSVDHFSRAFRQHKAVGPLELKKIFSRSNR